MACSPRRYGPWAAHPATARTKTMRPSARLIGMITIDDSSSAASSFFALDRAHMAMYPMPQEVTSSLSGPPRAAPPILGVRDRAPASRARRGDSHGPSHQALGTPGLYGPRRDP